MSGEVRLSEAERNEVVFRFYDASTSEEAIETVERILAARLAAVPVPSDTGLGAAVEALADNAKVCLSIPPADCTNACYDGPCACSGNFRAQAWDISPAELRALLSERTATTGGGGS